MGRRRTRPTYELPAQFAGFKDEAYADICAGIDLPLDRIRGELEALIDSSCKLRPRHNAEASQLRKDGYFNAITRSNFPFHVMIFDVLRFWQSVGGTLAASTESELVRFVQQLTLAVTDDEPSAKTVMHWIQPRIKYLKEGENR